MKTQREVFNKLFKEEKTELSAKKIELGMHEDMLKRQKRGDDLLSDVKQRIKALETSLKAVKHNYQVSEGIIEDAMVMAKELGATELINLYKKRETSVKGGIKEADRFISKLK